MAKLNVGRPLNPTLSQSNIDKLVNYVNGVKYGIREATSVKLVDELAHRAQELFRRNIRASIQHPSYSTGDFEAGAVAYVEKYATKGDDFKIRIANTSRDFVYFEYGTGIEGMDSPHDLAEERGYEYDVNGRGEDGWYFPSSVVRKSNGQPAWIPTKGQPASMAMYNTQMEIRESYPKDLVNNIRSRLVRVPKL